jgi:hypothetical protein
MNVLISDRPGCLLLRPQGAGGENLSQRHEASGVQKIS